MGGREMSDTPKTDFATLLQFKSMQNQIDELTTLLRNAQRERDEAREEVRRIKSESKMEQENTNSYIKFLHKTEQERDWLREQTAKLRDIAEKALDYLEETECKYFSFINQLRAELDQLKKEMK